MTVIHQGLRAFSYDLSPYKSHVWNSFDLFERVKGRKTN